MRKPTSQQLDNFHDRVNKIANIIIIVCIGILIFLTVKSIL